MSKNGSLPSAHTPPSPLPLPATRKKIVVAVLPHQNDNHISCNNNLKLMEKALDPVIVFEVPPN